MNKLLKKELKLAASPLAYFFILFGLMAMLPGYPILLGSFFVCLGIFQSFQFAREANDIVYSALLPVAKSDVVRSKFIFSVFIELCGFALMLISTLIRMSLLYDAPPYVNNALMTANFVFLGFVLVIFGLFNLIFIGGFFKTAYYYGKHFIYFIIAAFIVVGIAEALHCFPGLGALNSYSFENLGLQLSFLIGGIVLFVLLTLISLKISINRFEKIDL